jgi:23S rRNA U2552 (ribose-2'-O)-methylase RlmE/FtsJ
MELDSNQIKKDILMSKTFEEMTKAELADVAKLYKVEDKVAELAVERAKEAGKSVPKVPGNDCYIEVLNEVKESRAKEAGVKPESKGEVKIGNKHSSKGKSLAEIRSDFMHTKVEVIITDHDTSTSTEEELEGRIVNISWGNKRGKETARIKLNGGPQYVKEGALRAMETILLPTNMKDKSTRNKKRFGIEYLMGWTEEKRLAKIEEQKTKIAV